MCSQKCDAGHENNSGHEKADVRLISKLIFEADFEADFEASKPKNLKNGSHPRNIMPKKRFCLASLALVPSTLFLYFGINSIAPSTLYFGINSLHFPNSFPRVKNPTPHCPPNCFPPRYAID